MCKPSCCRNESASPGAGIAVAAVVMFAAFMVAKIGPIVAGFIHVALEVIRFTVLTMGVAAAVAVVTWAAFRLTRWQLQRRPALAASQTRVCVMPEHQQTGPSEQQDCLACGSTGMVLRAISGGCWQPGECPAYEPAQRAG